MTITQQGALNTTAINVPNLYVNIVPPTNNFINGIPSNILGLVGTAIWGPTNSPTTCGSLAQYVQNFGAIQPVKYDLGTAVAAACLQGANYINCVRVTDGTDTAATSAILDSASLAGLNLTAYYTGTLGNSIVATITQGTSYTPTVPSYRITLVIPGGTPESFDNISGVGFWSNAANAINMGQGSIRGPSQLAIASLSTGVDSGTVTTAGSYATLPTLAISGTGTGAAATLAMKGVTATVSAGGTGYVVGDTITLAGGTNTAPIVLTVATLASTAVATVNISNPGNYSALPTNPVAQGSTSGVGTGASFTILWGITSVKITTAGTNYTTATGTISGGGGTGGGVVTLAIGSANMPTLNSYNFTGGTNGSTTITGSTLLGSDTSPRKGIYSLRGTGTSVAALVDCDDATTYAAQMAYALSEGTYLIMVGPAGQSITSAVTTKQTNAVDCYGVNLLLGDWIYFQDTTNNVLRVISPQGFFAGLRSVLSPEQSMLNKQLNGIVATQKTYSNQVYSNAGLQMIASSSLEAITNPVPGGNYFASRIGTNSSSNASINSDNYTTLTNYIASTLNAAMGIYVGQLQGIQNGTTRLSAKTTLQTFLSNMQQQNMIDSFFVTLDSTNNSPSRIALGYLQADIEVRYLSVIRYFIINLQGGQGVQIQIQNTING